MNMQLSVVISVDPNTLNFLKNITGNIGQKLDEIITKENQIMSQLTDLQTQITTLQTEVSNLAADSQQAFSDLEAAVNAGNPDLSGPIASLAQVNAALQTLDAAAKTADPKNAPVISSALTLAAPLAGPAVSYQIVASNSPTSYAAAGLPAGLSVDPVAGLITGTPTTAGVSNVTISAINASGTGVATLVITAS